MKPALAVLFLTIATAPAVAQPAQSLPRPFDREGATKVLENDRVIVWDVAWLRRAYPTHRHLYDYTGVYYTSGDRIIVSPEGVRRPTHTRPGILSSSAGASRTVKKGERGAAAGGVP